MTSIDSNPASREGPREGTDSLRHVGGWDNGLRERHPPVGQIPVRVAAGRGQNEVVGILHDAERFAVSGKHGRGDEPLGRGAVEVVKAEEGPASPRKISHLVHREFRDGRHVHDPDPPAPRINPAVARPTELALSIRQPWAWLILHAGKDVENRSWPTRVRGRFLIHAAKGMTKTEYKACRDFIVREFPHVFLPPAHELPLGGIVGEADLVDCVTASKSRWFFGACGFVLRNARPLDFVSCPGELRFWKWPSNAPGEAPRTGGPT